MKSKGPAQSGFNARPFDYNMWRLEQARRKKQYQDRERLRTQLKLPLDVPAKTICPECGCRSGVNCKNCNSTGFVDRVSNDTHPVCIPSDARYPEENRESIKLPDTSGSEVSTPDTSSTLVNEVSRACARCWGVGRIAVGYTREKQCPDCGGSGKWNPPKID